MKAYEHLIQYALNHGHNVSVFDGEQWMIPSRNYARIIADIESVDEARISINDKLGARIARALVSAHGLADDETVIDHTECAYMDAWQAAFDDTTAEPLTLEQIREAAAELRTGRHGSFAAAIGDAALNADSHNLQRLAEAFPDLFAKAAAFA